MAAHFIAVSITFDEVARFGIAKEAVFGFWDWVGGRFSVGSVIGLNCMITLGPTVFVEVLEGMRTIDEHFPRSTRLPRTSHFATELHAPRD